MISVAHKGMSWSSLENNNLKKLFLLLKKVFLLQKQVLMMTY